MEIRKFKPRGKPFCKGQDTRRNPKGRAGTAIVKWLKGETITECEVRERFRILNHLNKWYTIELSQDGFPDIIMRDNQGNLVRAEIEIKSGHFASHRHNVEQCDLIICWNHTWKDCPVPVLALSRIWSEQSNELDIIYPLPTLF